MRVAGFVVTLKDDVSAERAQAVAELIGLVGGVWSVKPIETDYALHASYEKARHELVMKLWDVLK